jgi:hypothetical protein
MLGVLVLISVVQSIKVRSMPVSFTGGLLTRMIALVIVPFTITSIIAILGCTQVPNWIFSCSQLANWALIVSFLSLVLFLIVVTTFLRDSDRKQAAEQAAEEFREHGRLPR